MVYVNYRKRLSDTWWILSMRLRTRLGHGQYLLLCKVHRRSIEIRPNQIVGCWSWIIQACVSVIFQWQFLLEPSKNIHEKIEILRSLIYNFRSPRYGRHMHYFPMAIPARTIQKYTWKNRNPSISDLQLKIAKIRSAYAWLIQLQKHLSSIFSANLISAKI